ncbi:MAG: alpha/beta hydrolase [Acidimicrobiales bacterium]
MDEFVRAFRERVALATREPGMATGELHEVRDLLAGSVPVRVYRPSAATAPLLCYLHGAGFVAGDLDTHDQICRLLAVRVDGVVVAVDYRLAPEHPFPAPVDDALAAVAWAVGHAAELGADASRWAVVGDSAGGTLAAVVAQHWQGRPDGPCVQALVCPALQLDEFELPSHHEFAAIPDGFNTAVLRQVAGIYLGDGADRRDPRASPARATMLGGLAPTVLITAERDPLRDDGEAYARRLVEAGVPVTVFRHLGMVHYGVWWCRGAAEVAPGIDVVVAALASALHPPSL